MGRLESGNRAAAGHRCIGRSWGMPDNPSSHKTWQLMLDCRSNRNSALRRSNQLVPGALCGELLMCGSIDLELLDPIAQRPEADSEQLGRGCLVVLCLLKRFDNSVTLNVLKLGTEGCAIISNFR